MRKFDLSIDAAASAQPSETDVRLFHAYLVRKIAELAVREIEATSDDEQDGSPDDTQQNENKETELVSRPSAPMQTTRAGGRACLQN